MKNFNEWKEQHEQHEDQDLFIDRLDELADLIEQELKSFAGKRFDGILKIIGAHKDLKRSLQEIKTGCASDTSLWLTK